MRERVYGLVCLYMISLFSLIIDAGWDSEVCMRLHLAFGMGIFVVG